MIDWVMSFIPDWLSFLSAGVVYRLNSLIFLFCLYDTFRLYCRTVNGLLAEKVEKMLTGEAVNDDGLAEIMKDVPRT